MHETNARFVLRLRLEELNFKILNLFSIFILSALFFGIFIFVSNLQAGGKILLHLVIKTSGFAAQSVLYKKSFI